MGYEDIQLIGNFPRINSHNKLKSLRMYEVIFIILTKLLNLLMCCSLHTIFQEKTMIEIEFVLLINQNRIIK